MSDDKVKAAAQASMGALAERYVQFREALAQKKKEYDEIVLPYLEALGIIERAMLMKLHAEKATNAKTLHGTVYIFPQTTAQIVDMDALWEYMKEHDRVDLLQRRVTVSVLNEINEANPKAPVPGVHTEVIQTARVRAR